MSGGGNDEKLECDVLVIGSGAGGFAAAITARKLGLDVLMIEKEACFGGTTALSGGWLWIPCSPPAQRAGIADSRDAARAYLKAEVGASYDPARIDAFLENGPRMVSFFERETAVAFLLGRDYPDYHPEQPGALPGGRAICAAPFDGRALGARLAQLRPPVRELTLFGLKVGSGPDFRHFSNALRSVRSALYVAGRICKHATDVLLHGRDMLLMSGNALVARLAKTAFDLGIPLWLRAPATRLCLSEGRVIGALVMREGRSVTISARRAVVCAAGGFPHDPQLRQRLYPHAPAEGEHYSLAAPGNTGDGLRMAVAAGGAIDESCSSAGSWMPVSRVAYRNGGFGVYPHSFERGKPGVIAVTVAGRRFVNESNSYHDFVHGMLHAPLATRPAIAWFICDATFIRRYGLGIAKPFPVPLRPYVRSGYLKCGATIAELARQTGIEVAVLEETVARFNGFALTGIDAEFGRGSNVYNRYHGDPSHGRGPNPCLAPIASAPFYAVRVLPGDLGTFTAVKTDRHARVLDARDEAIAGLYAVGTDMAPIFGGSYPGPGSNLGPAMTFGFLAAEHIAGGVIPEI